MRILQNIHFGNSDVICDQVLEKHSLGYICTVILCRFERVCSLGEERERCQKDGEGGGGEIERRKGKAERQKERGEEDGV